MAGVRTRRRAERRERRRAARRGIMVGTAAAVVAVGTAMGMVSAVGGEDPGRDTARTAETTRPPTTAPLPARPAVSPAPSAASKSPPAPSASPSAVPKSAPKRSAAPAPFPEPGGGVLYRHPDSQVIDWVRAHRGDPRRALIEARIAARPAAVWFAAHNPGEITGEVRAVTSGAAALGRVPILVPYAIPDRDCGGASQGGAPDLDAYGRWIGEFADGLGTAPVIVVLEPDSLALSDCLSSADRAARSAALAKASRILKAANPRAKVYFDAGHSGWHSPATMARLLRAAGAATGGDGIFTNVSNFHRTADETRYARAVLDALGGPARLGAVIDTSRNGNGAPRAGAWCDPGGRALGQAPTTRTGQARIDAFLWIKLPGESDGCRGAAGSFTPDYAYDLATG
ncbi:glycoside hydrolase family 6 protein [Streptomyces sp. SCSIO 30461]|uniref:glycoside hydrolase family 6 protein n=1 Tax=Streptomyces sp. SCSIO 30461 TaxID=3118085 RepID=UPI0030CFC4BB